MVKRRNRDDPGGGSRSKAAKAAKPEDDAALWRAFAKQIEPLELKPRVQGKQPVLPEETLKGGGNATDARSDGPGAGGGKTASKPVDNSPRANRPSKARPASAASPEPLNQIDSRQVRRMGTGRSGVDARIDLHGMRQREAYGQLRSFLYRSAARGHRMVLVITGKGSARLGGEMADARYGSYINEGANGGGVLRRSVPLWLAEPELRAIVIGYTTAHIKHGGEGALYVQLRRRKA